MEMISIQLKDANHFDLGGMEYSKNKNKKKNI